MSAWEDYLAATQRLDAVRREAASVVAERVAAVKAAQADLAGVRQRVTQQHTRLASASKEAGVPVPDTGPAEPVAVTAEPIALRAALKETGATLTAADALLSTVERSNSTRLSRISNWPIVPRNLMVYLGFALLSVLVPLITLGATTNKFLLLPTIGCATVLPLFGYGLAWLSVGMLYRPEHTGRVQRTPLIGAAATVATVIVLYVLYAVLSITHAL
jgi:hypothetical protein